MVGSEPHVARRPSRASASAARVLHRALPLTAFFRVSGYVHGVVQPQSETSRAGQEPLTARLLVRKKDSPWASINPRGLVGAAAFLHPSTPSIPRTTLTESPTDLRLPPQRGRTCESDCAMTVSRCDPLTEARLLGCVFCSATLSPRPRTTTHDTNPTNFTTGRVIREQRRVHEQAVERARTHARGRQSTSPPPTVLEAGPHPARLLRSPSSRDSEYVVLPFDCVMIDRSVGRTTDSCFPLQCPRPCRLSGSAQQRGAPSRPRRRCGPPGPSSTTTRTRRARRAPRRPRCPPTRSSRSSSACSRPRQPRSSSRAGSARRCWTSRRSSSSASARSPRCSTTLRRHRPSSRDGPSATRRTTRRTRARRRRRSAQRRRRSSPRSRKT